MKSKNKLLRKSRLYAILDREILGSRSLLHAADIIKGKYCNIIQFRDKVSDKESVLEKAFALRRLLLKSAALLIINDYLDIAKIIDSDGIHLGQDDVPIEIARKILGEDKVIGISCHSLRQALLAQDCGADYVSLGPAFATFTKPEYKPVGLGLIRKFEKKIKIPFFVIGGINLTNINRVVSKGAVRVAVCSAICQAKNIAQTIRNFKNQLDN